MTLKTLNRKNSKGPEVKRFFIMDLFLTKCVRTISDKRLFFKAVFGDFSI
jgi:hypothetical protein